MDTSGWIQCTGGVVVGIFGMNQMWGVAGFTLAMLGALSPLLAMWPTFKTLERRDPNAPAEEDDALR